MTRDTLFAQFEDAPLASASIAQVHRARLHTGEDVVVKVQHAGIADKIMPDLDILAGLAELAEKHLTQFVLTSRERWSGTSGAHCCASSTSPSSAATWVSRPPSTSPTT